MMIRKQWNMEMQQRSVSQMEFSGFWWPGLAFGKNDCKPWWPSLEYNKRYRNDSLVDMGQ